MEFGTEAELVKLLMKVGHAMSPTKGWPTSGVISEFDSSFGRADLVLYNLKEDWKDALGLGEICPRWAYALKSLPYRKSFSLGEFLSLTGVSQKSGSLALNQFVELGYCHKLRKKDEWVKVNQPRAIVSEILAIEAKLRDWNRALSQAYRYKEYASQSWVVLDSASVKPAIAHVNKFEHLNVGLGSINREGSFSIHYKPKKSKPQSSHRFWQANAQIASQILLATT
jgi:hypothetical protein